VRGRAPSGSARRARLAPSNSRGAPRFRGSHAEAVGDLRSRFLSQIRDYQATFTPLVWLEQWIAEDLMSAERAGARRISARRSRGHDREQHHEPLVRSRASTGTAFVESQSAIERVLRSDPSGDYRR
jgi:hypothetical protein